MLDSQIMEPSEKVDCGLAVTDISETKVQPEQCIRYFENLSEVVNLQ